MNGKTGGNRDPWRAGALVVVAAVAVLATACGSSAPSSASAPTYAQELALVGCMRSHGVPNFPSPGQGTAPPDSAPTNVNSPQYLAAAGACQHLLPAGAHVTFHRSAS